jgi:hypothetical protein
MKTLIHKIYLALLFLITAMGSAHAQSSGPSANVSGSLLDELGKPMMYATASLLNAKDSTIVKGAISNEQGVYSFDHIKQGRYVIKATTVGYQKAISQPITVATNGPVTVPELKMRPTAHNLNAVNVTAAKPLIERKIDRTVVNVANSPLCRQLGNGYTGKGTRG